MQQCQCSDLPFTMSTNVREVRQANVKKADLLMDLNVAKSFPSPIKIEGERGCHGFHIILYEHGHSIADTDRLLIADRLSAAKAPLRWLLIEAVHRCQGLAPAGGLELQSRIKMLKAVIYEIATAWSFKR